MTQWVFSPVCMCVCGCVCGAGSGGRDGALWQPHHHGDSGIIASGGHWCWSEYSIGSRKEQHGNDRIHWAAGQTSGCMSHRALGNASSSSEMPVTVNFSGFTVILVTPKPLNHKIHVRTQISSLENGAAVNDRQLKPNETAAEAAGMTLSLLPEEGRRVSFVGGMTWCFGVCQRLQINWTHWSLHRLFAL